MSTGRGTPLVRALALQGVSGDSGSHLGSTLNPGGAVLTLGVFRRSRSVAYIPADASPSEVLASAIVPPRATVVNPTRRDFALLRAPHAEFEPHRHASMSFFRCSWALSGCGVSRGIVNSVRAAPRVRIRVANCSDV